MSSIRNVAYFRRKFSSAEDGSIPNLDKIYFNVFQEKSTKKDEPT